ncbi:MAG: hypothetical protein AAF383_26280 [Cyanobacteria bacterium P01_A01_bin.83]
MQTDIDTAQQLIAILQDRSISWAERDDAAIDLANFDLDFVLSALVEIAQDQTEDELILASCGESIAEILLRRNLRHVELIQQLSIPARNEAKALIKVKSPNWIS